MKIFEPDYIFKSIVDITPEFLKNLGIKNVFLDLDNTLSLHGSQTPAPGVLPWIKNMKSRGLKLVLVSNNNKKRVEPFANLIDLPFVSMALKPLPVGFSYGRRKIGGTKKDTAVIGDQIYTDVLGAHLAGMIAILVLPIKKEEGLCFRIRRRGEKKYISAYENKHNIIK
jgi:HAD superfamily phosphatase (TIGR01668 family)